MSETRLPNGPGTQPVDEDGSIPEYLEMPSEMATFSLPALPEADEAAGCEAGLWILGQAQAACALHNAAAVNRVFDITALDNTNKAFVAQVLGEGEVAIIAGPDVQVQESVLAGVWRLRRMEETGAEREEIVVGGFPRDVIVIAEEGAAKIVEAADEALPDGVINAPALLTELGAALGQYEASGRTHAINLSLLPHTEADLEYLADKLGRGLVTVLSRGYGNCRISATGTAHVWWVQYFNSQDALILNTLEVARVPDVACAAPEDLEASAERLAEIIEVYKS